LLIIVVLTEIYGIKQLRITQLDDVTQIHIRKELMLIFIRSIMCVI